MSSNLPEQETLKFGALKEHRGSYYVEYQPPASGSSIAILNLVYSQDVERDAVAENVVAEVEHWLRRFPVPVMATAWDLSENKIRPTSLNDDGHLMGWIEPNSDKLRLTWNLKEAPRFDALSQFDLLRTYREIPYRTGTEIKKNVEKEIQERRKSGRLLKTLLLIWCCVIPAAWALLQLLGPQWLGVLVTAYAMFQILILGRKILGLGQPSEKEKVEAAIEQKMRHYYYQCERNPEGFALLKAQNFDEEARQRNSRASEELMTAAINIRQSKKPGE